MSSPAASRYMTAAGHIRTLCKAATDGRLRPMLQEEIQVYYHASLAAYVAAWNAYIKNLVIDFYNVIADPSNPRFQAIYITTRHLAIRAIDRFNTPNWENTRNLLNQYTGYDPINDWVWLRRGMDRFQVQERWKEILQVRHSFAHGFDVRAYDWTQSPSGRVRLTSKAVQETEAFFKNLVNVTDGRMKAYINQTYGIPSIW